MSYGGKLLFLSVFSIFVLVGCSDNLHSESSNEKVTSIKTSEQKDSLIRENEIKLNDFNKTKVIALDGSNDSGYTFSDIQLENAECIIFQPIHLKKSEKITLKFQLQSNDSINHISIGIIKDFIPNLESNYKIEKIHSKSINNDLTVTYTSQADSNYSITILGTMANTVVLTNGKITKN